MSEHVPSLAAEHVSFHRSIWVALVFVALAYAVYAGMFIQTTSVEIGGERYYALFDDAMISMRYARNLAEGNGLTWNPNGERVEGFTNPLWTFAMAGVHLLPIQISKMSLVVQSISALLMIGTLFAVARVTRQLTSSGSWLPVIAATLTAFYLPLNHWALYGMEVGLLALLLAVAVLYAIRAVRTGESRWKFFAVLALMTFVRMDALIPAVVLLGYVVLYSQNRKRVLFTGMTVLLCCLAAQTILRVAYYGDIFPNTYYLKMTGYPALYRMGRGAYETLQFLRSLNPLVILLALSFILFRRDRLLLLPLALFAGQLGYSIYVGGDAWEWWGGSNRYTAVSMPMFFVLLVVSSGTVYGRLVHRFSALLRWGPLAGILGTVILLIAMQVRTIWGRLDTFFLVKPPLHILEHRQTVVEALELKGKLAPGARVGVVWAGILPYYVERECIDLLGKNDRYISHLPMRTVDGGITMTSFYPGHMKYDYSYSIGKLQPDVVISLWRSKEEAYALLEKNYLVGNLNGRDYFLKENSRQILWDAVGSGLMKFSDWRARQVPSEAPR